MSNFFDNFGKSLIRLFRCAVLIAFVMLCNEEVYVGGLKNITTKNVQAKTEFLHSISKSHFKLTGPSSDFLHFPKEKYCLVHVSDGIRFDYYKSARGRSKSNTKCKENLKAILKQFKTQIPNPPRPQRRAKWLLIS